jgi:uncharacterized membrane protein YhaH (DUF805 family)
MTAAVAQIMKLATDEDSVEWAWLILSHPKALAPEGWVQINTRVGPEVPFLVAALLLILVLCISIIWSNFVIEVKRWHDRGLTGFLFLIRLIPWFLRGHGESTSITVAILINVFLLVQLGVIGSAKAED